MRNWQRKLFFSTGLAIFLVISPLLVLYATGYRLDFENKEIRQVGIIDIDVTPKNAEVFLDEKKITSSTPFQIKNLFPRDYQLKLTKEGYSTWEKKISVDSKKVSWIKNPRLFFKNPKSELITLKKVKKFAASESGQSLLFSSEEKNEEKGLWLIDVKKNSERMIFPKNNEEKSGLQLEEAQINGFEFSQNEEWVIFFFTPYKDAKEMLGLIDLNDKDRFVALVELNNAEIKRAVIFDNFLLYLDQNKNINQIDLKLKKTNLLAENVETFDIVKNNLFYCQKIEDKIKFFRRNQNSLINFIQEPNQLIFETKGPAIKNFALSAKENLAFLNEQKQLYLYLTDKAKLIKLGSEIEEYLWANKSEKILFRNKNEIFFYEFSIEENSKQDYQVNQINFVTRYSKPIDRLSWYPTEEWIALAFDKELKLSELDSRDNRNSFSTLNNTPFEPGIYFDAKGKILYYLNPEENKLYSLLLQEK